MIKSIFRIATLISLLAIALLFIFGEIIDSTIDTAANFILIKLVGVMVAWAVSRLYTQWAVIDRWIAAYDKWCKQYS